MIALDSLGKDRVTMSRGCGEGDRPVALVPSPTAPCFFAVLNIPNKPVPHPGVLAGVAIPLLSGDVGILCLPLQGVNQAISLFPKASLPSDVCKRET
mmetsp:Transcript_9887/g.23381  ORF Transcript_9887/g.23381 Transcript_9887/m.23381 type:complete len:97 (-) Transcript_9887:7-297(-)